MSGWIAKGTPPGLYAIAIVSLPGLIYYAVSNNVSDAEYDADGEVRVSDPKLFITLMFLVLCQTGQFGLVIRYSKDRLNHYISLWPPLAAAGAISSVLTMACIIAVFAFNGEQRPLGHVGTIAFLVFWIGWTAFFGWITQSLSPELVAFRLHYLLLRCSILAFAIVEMIHYIVSKRTEDPGHSVLTTGPTLIATLAFAILAFGPSVIVLYLRRVRHIPIPGSDDKGANVAKKRWYLRIETISLGAIALGVVLLLFTK